MRKPILGILALGAATLMATRPVAANDPPPPPGAKPGVAPPAWLRPGDPNAKPGKDELIVRWLGVAGFELRSATTTLLIDPYFSRRPLAAFLGGPALPDMAEVHKYLRPADAVFVSHAHFDHLLDAPAICKEQRIPLYTSDQGERIANAAGLPAALQKPIAQGQSITVGDFTVEPIASKHSDMVTQWLAGGDNPPVVHWPMGFLAFHNGPVYDFLIRWRGRSLFHAGSAQIVEQAVGERQADVALLCLTGWTSTPHYFARVGNTLHPRVVVPMHDDDFFKPLSEGFHENLLAKRAEGLATLRRDIPEATLVTLDFLEALSLHAAGAAK